MDYKQKIKEYLNSDIDVLYKNMLLNLFPELKESEDEKIRKEFRKDIWTYIPNEKAHKYIAWLEKQGGHNPAPAWSEEDKDFMYDTLSNLTELKDRYGEGYGNVGKCIDWLKSLKERYTWKPSDEQLNALHDAAVYVDKSMFPYPKGTLMKLYNQLKKLKE